MKCDNKNIWLLMKAQLLNVATFFIILKKVFIKNKKNQWFNTFDNNENIKIIKENIDYVICENETKWTCTWFNL